MTIYELPIPQQTEGYILQILDDEEGETDFRSDYTRFLCEAYLKYIEPWRWHNKDYAFELARYKSCPKCVVKTWEYFRKRYNKA